jgi:hypothetical protein
MALRRKVTCNVGGQGGLTSTALWIGDNNNFHMGLFSSDKCGPIRQMAYLNEKIDNIDINSKAFIFLKD